MSERTDERDLKISYCTKEIAELTISRPLEMKDGEMVYEGHNAFEQDREICQKIHAYRTLALRLRGASYIG